MEVREVPTYKASKAKKRASKRTKPFKRLTPHRKAVQARKALRKAYKKKYGTKEALKRADTAFSAQIRKRDGKCMFPGCGICSFDLLQNSHYISRAVSATRFDPDNCIALCWNHHYKDKMLGWEYAKQRVELHGRDGDYTTFMKKKLGDVGFTELEARSKLVVKRIDAVKSFLDAYGV